MRLPSDIAGRVTRLSRMAWDIRAAGRVPTELPFAFAFFTDDRRHSDVEALLAEFPTAKEAGVVAVVFRHDGLPPTERQVVAERCLSVVRQKGHVLLMARGSLRGADGVHATTGQGIVSMPIHSLNEARVAAKLGADLGFVSPVFPTISHPGAPALGPVRAIALARHAGIPCFALGGLTPETLPRLRGYPFAGFGAIGLVTD